MSYYPEDPEPDGNAFTLCFYLVVVVFALLIILSFLP